MIKGIDLESTDNVSNCAAIAEPSVRESIAKINAVPGQVCLSQASWKVHIISHIGKRVAEDELHHLAVAAGNGGG